MSVLHVYDNKGLFENHPIGHCKKFYHLVYNEKEDQDEVVFLPTISGVDMFGNFVTGKPLTVVQGEFVIIEKN